MSDKQTNSNPQIQIAKLLRDLIIIELGLAGVSQSQIRSIVGGDMNKINKIVKLLRPKRSKSAKERE